MTNNIRTTGFSALLIATLLIMAIPANAQQSLFSDIKAYRIGDAITITLAERTAAQRESGWGRKTNSNLGGSGGVAGGSTVNGSFGLDAQFNSEASNKNDAVQKDLLTGVMTAVIVAVDSLSGNLVIEGERHLNVNGDTHIMKVKGSIRPYDVLGDNSVMPYQLANAKIEYRRAGGLKRAFIGPGTLATVAGVLDMGAAVVVGMSN